MFKKFPCGYQNSGWIEKEKKRRFMNGGSWRNMMDALNLERRTKNFFTGA
jgi:hypothetical protein